MTNAATLRSAETLLRTADAEPSATAVDAPGSLAETLAADAGVRAQDPADASRDEPAVRRRTFTVLPRIELDASDRPVVVPDPKPRYEEVETIGAGGMGEVALVRDHDIGRTVALKRMLPEVTRPTTLARFVDEVRTIGTLEHPGIVPIHDVGVDERGRYFFVMKYVEGETLEHVIERLRAGDAEYHAKYPIEERVRVFAQLLHALGYAHAQGIVHRDLKPANVMVGRYGEVVLMDWGIAKRVGARELATDEAPAAVESAAPGARTERRALSTQAGQLLGTPAYMSPEQARGHNDRIDARSDLYSAVVLFHELLTLRHYLEHRTTLPGLLRAVAQEEPPFAALQKTAPGQKALPSELVHLVRKGLRKDPAHRYQSTSELLALLRHIDEGRVPVQCHATMTKRMFRELGRFTDRHPNLGFFAFLGGVGMLLAGAIALVASF